MFIINSQSSISIANVINNWLDYMKSVTIFNFDKINLFADINELEIRKAPEKKYR